MTEDKRYGRLEQRERPGMDAGGESSPAPPFETTISKNGDTICVAFAGELDLACKQIAERELARTQQSNPSVLVLDLRELSFMDVTGLNLILAADGRARAEGRRLAVALGCGPCRRVMELAGVETELELVGEPSEVESAHSPPQMRSHNRPVEKEERKEGARKPRW